MKRFLLLVAAIILIVVGLFLLAKVSTLFKTEGQGALQVTANVKSNVYLNGNYLGTTPLCKCQQDATITEGEYTVKIEPQDKNQSPFTIKAAVHPGVLTAVERTFLPGSLASAYVLTLEKINGSNSQLQVVSIPDGAMVSIDNNPTNVTPMLLQNITPSEHEIEIEKDGYAKKTIRVRTVPSYKLIINAILGIASDDTTNPVTPSLTPTTTISPSPTVTSSPTVKILNTPTGFLRVRSQPSTAGSEVGQVQPGETYNVLNTQSGWYQIQLESGTKGWISGEYAQESQ